MRLAELLEQAKPYENRPIALDQRISTAAWTATIANAAAVGIQLTIAPTITNNDAILYRPTQWLLTLADNTTLVLVGPASIVVAAAALAVVTNGYKTASRRQTTAAAILTTTGAVTAAPSILGAAAATVATVILAAPIPTLIAVAAVHILTKRITRNL